MALRKKFSRKFSKANLKDEAPPPPVPTFDATRLALPAVRPTSPLLDSSPLLSRRTTRKHHAHRRSRSFSALTPPSASFAKFTPSRDSTGSQYSSQSNYSIDQPWRSQDTWRALHTPPAHPSSPLTHPSALPEGSGGWRGKVGEGFFAGRNTPRLRRKTLEGEESTPDLSGTEEWEDRRGELLYKLQGLQREQQESPYSTLPRLATSGPRSSPLKMALLPSPSVPEMSHSAAASEESHAVQTPTYAHGHQRNESILPPLIPINVHKQPRRTSSFASLRSNRPTITPRESFDGSAPALIPAAIPWGRRSSSERRSASPTWTKPPIPARSALRAPRKALPAPPPAQAPLSPEMDDESLPEIEDDFDQDRSISPVRERLTTPVTPPGGIGRRGTKSSQISGWSGGSNRGTMSAAGSRQPSWATTESKSKTRGGWI